MDYPSIKHQIEQLGHFQAKSQRNFFDGSKELFVSDVQSGKKMGMIVAGDKPFGFFYPRYNIDDTSQQALFDIIMGAIDKEYLSGATMKYKEFHEMVNYDGITTTVAYGTLEVYYRGDINPMATVSTVRRLDCVFSFNDDLSAEINQAILHAVTTLANTPIEERHNSSHCLHCVGVNTLMTGCLSDTRTRDTFDLIIEKDSLKLVNRDKNICAYDVMINYCPICGSKLEKDSEQFVRCSI